MSVCSQLGLSHAGHFLGWQLKKLDLINMCRQPALCVQIGADLEGVKWARNGYELKLKRWPQETRHCDNAATGHAGTSEVEPNEA